MNPCSLCGALAINEDCLRCESRVELFAQLPPHVQKELCKADRARGITKSGVVAAELVRRSRRIADPSRPPSVGLVGCGKAKLRDRALARDLYIGNLFRAALAHSERACDETYILSAANGLVHLNTLLFPYDKTMTQLTTMERKIWGERVVASLAVLFPVMNVNFFMFAGSSYIEPIVMAAWDEGWPWTFNEPLEGLTLGQRLRWFKQECST